MCIPSSCLKGLKLNNGWTVIEEISKHPTATGGCFSTGYKVKKDNQTAFLKALDFSDAFNSPDTARRLQELTEAYNFERDILMKCKGKHLDKIVYSIEDGKVVVPGFPPYIGTVYYLVFELADGDIRKIKDYFKKIDLAFIFRSLHNTAVGIKQLHTNEIAHQDIKPSNVLVFKKDSKIADIGRASDRNKSFMFDNLKIPGDRNYAPIEQKYGFHYSSDFSEKYAADLFLFGSLFFFHFIGTSAAQSIIMKSRFLGIIYTNVFENDLPEIIRAYNLALDDLKQAILEHLNEKDSEEIICIVKSLCYPDPRKRGYPKNVETKNNQYSMERYISRLDYFAKKAEFKLI